MTALPQVGSNLFNQPSTSSKDTSKENSSVNTPTFAGSPNNSGVKLEEVKGEVQKKKSVDDFKKLIN
jgi:hypothetical protein